MVHAALLWAVILAGAAAVQPGIDHVRRTAAHHSAAGAPTPTLGRGDHGSPLPFLAVTAPSVDAGTVQTRGTHGRLGPRTARPGESDDDRRRNGQAISRNRALHLHYLEYAARNSAARAGMPAVHSTAPPHTPHS